METKALGSGADLAVPNEATSLFRQATDIAGICKEIVLKTSVTIQKRRFVRVEGWTSIAVCHKCAPTIKSVTETPSGILAVAEVRRQSDGFVLSSAEGYVGRDETVWYGGRRMKWDDREKREIEVIDPKRDDYAIRSMAQTRAVAKACRILFAHVVVLMNAGLETTPAEEVDPDATTDVDTKPVDERKGASGGTAETASGGTPPESKKEVSVPRDGEIGLRTQFEGGKWKTVSLHFGKNKGAKLGDLETSSLRWYQNEWTPKAFGNRPIPETDLLLRAALDVSLVEEPAQ